MAVPKKLVRWLAVAVAAVAVLVISPAYLISWYLEPEFGASEMRAAVEGTWQLTIEQPDAPRRTLTFRLAHSTRADPRGASRHFTSRGLVQPAAACGHRSLVRSAEACLETTDMPLDVTLLAADGSRRQLDLGSFLVTGTQFRAGSLVVQLDEIKLKAKVSPLGEATEIDAGGTSGAPVTTLMRIAR